MTYNKKKPAGYWTKERVFEEARKYKTKYEFEKGCGSACSVARKNGWIQEMFWFVEGKKCNGYWNIKENVFNESHKYKTKRDFKKGCQSAYQSARRHDWLKEMVWLEKCDNTHTDPIYVVYCYKFIEYNSIYIGLTMRPKIRDFEHRSGDRYSSVYNFANEHNIDIPEMEILIDGLYQTDAQLYEDKFKQEYSNNGFTIINIGPTGVGVGALGGATKKWTKKAILAEGRKYRTRTAFYKGNRSAYQSALNKKLLDEMDWFEDGVKIMAENNRIWTRDTIFEEAKKYETKEAFKKGGKGAYNAAREQHLIKEMDWFREVHKPKDYWTKERVFEEARKYRTKMEFYNGNKALYVRASLKNWLPEMDWFENGHKIKWTRDAILEESKKYKTKTEFNDNCRGAFQAAKKLNLFDEMDWFEERKKPSGYWTKEHIFEESKKYQTKEAFKKGSSGAYMAARKLKIIDQLFPKK